MYDRQFRCISIDGNEEADGSLTRVHCPQCNHPILIHIPKRRGSYSVYAKRRYEELHWRETVLRTGEIRESVDSGFIELHVIPG